MQEPRSMGTRNIIQNKAQHQEGANEYCAKLQTIPGQENQQTSKHTTLEFAKGGNNIMYHQQICDTMHSNKEHPHS